jgi:hypothetical protein
VECKNKRDTSNNTGYWNHLKIIQKIPEQYSGKHDTTARNCKKQPYWALHTTAESANVKVQNIQHGK